jgi:hypothetical protein
MGKFFVKNKLLYFLFSSVVSLIGLSSSTAFAWDGLASGQIDIIQGTGAGNMPFRVTLKGSPTLCGNSNAWGYLSDVDSNYKTNAALLMSAKAQGSTVALYSVRDSQGYCQIGFLQIQ